MGSFCTKQPAVLTAESVGSHPLASGSSEISPPSSTSTQASSSRFLTRIAPKLATLEEEEEEEGEFTDAADKRTRIHEAIQELLEQDLPPSDALPPLLQDDPPPSVKQIRLKFSTLMKLLRPSGPGLHSPDVYSHQPLHSNLRYSSPHSPLPIYRTLHWLGEFGDEYLTKTEYDDRAPYMDTTGNTSVMDNWLRCLKVVLRDTPHWLVHSVDMADPRGDSRIQRFLKILEEGVKLEKLQRRMYGGEWVEDGYASAKGLRKFVLKCWIPRLRRMSVGGIIGIPAGWSGFPGHCVFLTIERMGQESYSLIISNSGGGLEFHATSCADYPVGKKYVDGRIDDIPVEKMFRGMTWMLFFLIHAYSSDSHSCLSMYDVVLPMFIPKGSSVREEFARSFHKPDVAAKRMIPQQSGTCFYKAVTFGTRYIMRLVGIPDEQVHTIRFAVQRQFLQYALQDVTIQPTLTPSELKLIRLGMEQVAIFGKIQRERDRVDARQLREIERVFDALSKEMEAKPLLELEVPRKVQRELALGPAVPNETGDFVIRMPAESEDFPLFDVFFDQEANQCSRRVRNSFDLRLSGIFKLYRDSSEIKDFAELMLLFQSAARIGHVIMQIPGSSRYYYLMVFLEKIVLELVPIPTPAQPALCFYSRPNGLSFDREGQISLLLGIEEVLRLFQTAVMSLPPSSANIASHFLVVGVLFTLIDTIVRMQPTDQKSVFAELIAEFSTCSGSVGNTISFAEYSSRLELTQGNYPRVYGVLNEYVRYQEKSHWKSILEIPTDHFFRFMGLEFTLVRRILEANGIAVTDLEPVFDAFLHEEEDHPIQMLSREMFGREGSHIQRVAPDFRVWRDARFSLAFAYRSSPDPTAVWSGRKYDYGRSRWYFRNQQVEETTAQRTIKIFVNWGVLQNWRGLVDRPKLLNLSAPENYVLERLDPDGEVTENDVLHNRILPSFDETLTQEDAERLFSFLVVPYLRIPLVLDFFTTFDRTTLLLNRQIRVFIWHVLFHPETWKSSFDFDYQTFSVVPLPNKNCPIGTPCGLLQNELLLSPSTVIEPLLKILGFVVGLPAEKFEETTAETMLWVVRLTSSIEGYVFSILEGCDEVDSSIEAYLRSSLRRFRGLLRIARTSLVCWIKETRDVFVKSRFFYHVSLIYSNLREFDAESVMWFLSSVCFVNLWYGFSGNILNSSVPLIRPMSSLDPENEDDQRNGVEAASTTTPRLFLDEIGFFHLIHDVGSRISQHFLERDSEDSEYISDVLSAVLARLEMSCNERIVFRPQDESYESFVSDSGDYLVLLPQCKCVFKKKLIKPIADEIMENFDYQCCFGTKPRHASVLSETEEFARLAVMGMQVRHEVLFWKKPKRSQFMLMDDKVLPDEQRDDDRCQTFLDECAGEYLMISAAPGSTNWVGKITSDGKWTNSNGSRMLMANSETENRLDVIGYGDHGKKGWKFRFTRDELSGKIDKMYRFQEVYVMTESHNPIPTKDFHAWYVNRSKFTRRYRLERLSNTEKWIGLALEPVLAEEFGPKKERMIDFDLFLPPCEAIPADVPFVKLLARFLPPPDPKVEETEDEKVFYGGVCWKEVLVHRQPVRVEVYNLNEHGRKIFRELVFTSNSRASFCDGCVSSDKRTSIWFENYQFAAGDLLRVSRRRDSLEIYREYRPLEGVDVVPELVGTRERHIPADFLVGSLPFVLAVNFLFWLRENRTIVGEPREHVEKSNLLGSLEDCRIIIRIRSEDGIASVSRRLSKDGKTEDLINISRPNRLTDVLTRMEDLSHILCWGRSRGTHCEIKRIELPRLGLSFFVGKDAGGRLKLFSVNHSGMFISDRHPPKVVRLLRGIPHGVLLENSSNSLFVLVPSYPVFLPRIEWQPLHDNLILMRNDRNWLRQPVRSFVYPVHVSNEFLGVSNLSSHLYLIILRLWTQQFRAASKLLDTLCLDSVPSQSEEFYLRLFAHPKLFGNFPDAFALRLRFFLAVRGLTPSLDLLFGEVGAGGYFTRSAFVRKGCQLKLDEALLLSRSAAGSAGSEFFSKIKKLQDGLHPDPVEMVQYSPSSSHETSTWESIESDSLEYFRGLNARKWAADLCYIRPPSDRLVGAECVEFVRRCWEDYPSGSLHKLGFLFLYEVLTGRVSLSFDGSVDDSFDLGRALAAAMFFQTTSQQHDVYEKDSSGADRSFTPFSILAALTKGRSSVYVPIESEPPSFTPVPLDDVVGVYTEKPHGRQGGRPMHIYRDFSGRYPNRPDGVGRIVIRFKDCLSFRFPRNTWRIDIIRNADGEATAMRMWGFEWERAKLYDTKGRRFDFPQIPDVPVDDDGKCLLEKSGSDGFSTTSSKTWLLAVGFVHHMCDVAEDVLTVTESIPKDREGEPFPVSVRVCSVPIPANPPYFQPEYERDLSSVSLQFSLQDASSSSLVGDLFHQFFNLAEFLDERPHCSSEDSVQEEGLGFDVTFHESSKSYSGQLLLSRLEKDKAIHSVQKSAALDVFLKHTFDESRLSVLRLILRLEAELSSHYESESEFGSERVREMVEVVNRVPCREGDKDRLCFYVAKQAHEDEISFLDLCSFVASSDFLGEVRSLNPFVNEGEVARIRVDTAKEMMRSIRLGAIGRALSSVRRLKKMIIRGEFGRVFQNESRVLAQILSSRRQFVQKIEGKDNLDPRLLYYEFVESIVLRNMQVDILGSFLEDGSQSVVRQLIMGAGKTMVIAPLLTLVLASPNDLLMHVVPSQLVEFTQSVLRTKFSSVITRRIHRLQFDRSPTFDAESRNGLVPFTTQENKRV